MATKQTKAQRIAELERKLVEALAGQVHSYHFACAALPKTSIKHLTGSAVMLELTFLGGKEVFSPVLIRDGLSDETIAALKADIFRSFELAAIFKPTM